MKRTSILAAICMGILAAASAGAQSAPASAATLPPPPAPGMGAGPQRFHDMHRGPDGPGGPDARLLPPGTWWRNQDVVSRIGLAADQQKHIDQIFLDSRVQLIRMHASLEEEELKLDSALQMTPFNQNEALAQIDKIADTRADLEKANAKMLLTIRGVLSADQWTRLQALGPGPGPGGPPRGMDDGKRLDHHGTNRGGRPDIGPDGKGGQGAPPPPPQGL